LQCLPLALVVALSNSNAEAADEAVSPSTAQISIDNPALLLSPYTWRRDGNGTTARAEAAMPGAYLKTTFQGTQHVGLLIDGTANNDCPAASMPVVEYSIDERAFTTIPLTRSGGIYTLPLADDLDPVKEHRLQVFFRAADLTNKRWASSQTHLRLAGLSLDAEATLKPTKSRPRHAIGFGDSIVEGVGTDGLFTSWQKLDVNDARGTWFPIVAEALQAEYGQLGSGGQGMTRVIHLPGLVDTWDRYDATTSRLTDGRLLPEPDYVFCAMGTNDFEKNITADYTRWLTEMRKACPRARFFCIVPPLGLHREEIAAAAAARREQQDLRVHLIEAPSLAEGFRVGQGATQLAYDGVHPSQYGHALLAAVITAEVQKIISRDD
jgi:lysophospholipase L1-like esterase